MGFDSYYASTFAAAKGMTCAESSLRVLVVLATVALNAGFLAILFLLFLKAFGLHIRKKVAPLYMPFIHIASESKAECFRRHSHFFIDCDDRASETETQGLLVHRMKYTV